MSIDSTRVALLRYLHTQHSDNSALTKDAVFTIMATGHQYRGHTAILSIADQFYYVDLTAVITVRVALFGEETAMVEADFKGWRIGAVEGVIATGESISIPLCVVYELEQDRIQRGRVYTTLPTSPL